MRRSDEGKGPSIYEQDGFNLDNIQNGGGTLQRPTSRGRKRERYEVVSLVSFFFLVFG